MRDSAGDPSSKLSSKPRQVGSLGSRGGDSSFPPPRPGHCSAHGTGTGLCDLVPLLAPHCELCDGYIPQPHCASVCSSVAWVRWKAVLHGPALGVLLGSEGHYPFQEASPESLEHWHFARYPQGCEDTERPKKTTVPSRCLRTLRGACVDGASSPQGFLKPLFLHRCGDLRARQVASRAFLECF